MKACYDKQLTACSWCHMDTVGNQAKQLWDVTVVQLEHTIKVFSMKDEQPTLVIIKKLDLQQDEARESASLLPLQIHLLLFSHTCSGKMHE